MIDGTIDNNMEEKQIATMPDYDDFYAFGLPIDSPLGKFFPLKVKDYPSHVPHLQIVQLTKAQIIQSYRKLNKGQEFEEAINKLEELSLFQIAINDPTIKSSYSEILDKCFNKKEIIYEIEDEETFDYCRQLIFKTNLLEEEEINPNPEIQETIERSRRIKNQGKEKFTLSDMVTSVAMISGIDYQEIMEWSIYQLHSSFYRIAKVMNYNTSILFSTVSTEKIEIIDWNGHIDLFEKEKHGLTRSEFSKVAGVMD